MATSCLHCLGSSESTESQVQSLRQPVCSKGYAQEAHGRWVSEAIRGWVLRHDSWTMVFQQLPINGRAERTVQLGDAAVITNGFHVSVWPFGDISGVQPTGVREHIATKTLSLEAKESTALLGCTGTNGRNGASVHAWTDAGRGVQDGEAMLCFMFMILVWDGRIYAGGAWTWRSHFPFLLLILCHPPLTSPSRPSALPSTTNIRVSLLF